jgi:general secretion pathway protein G
MKRTRSNRQRGFTLIEVLLVLVILCVLASLAVVAYGPIRRDALVKAAKSQIGLLDNAIKTYELQIGSPPSTAAGLQALRTRPGDLPDPSKWTAPILEKDVPLDPWDKPYQYACPGAHNPDSFDIWTIAPDGRELGNWTEEKK